MPLPPVNIDEITGISKQFIKRLLITGENRVELLMVELEEERQRLLQAILLALGVAAFGLIAGLLLTAGIVVLFWNRSPLGVLLVMTCLHALGAAFLGRRLATLLRDWRSLPSSLDQLRKDRACIEKSLQ